MYRSVRVRVRGGRGSAFSEENILGWFELMHVRLADRMGELPHIKAEGSRQGQWQVATCLQGELIVRQHRRCSIRKADTVGDQFTAGRISTNVDDTCTSAGGVAIQSFPPENQGFGSGVHGVCLFLILLLLLLCLRDFLTIELFRGSWADG